MVLRGLGIQQVLQFARRFARHREQRQLLLGLAPLRKPLRDITIALLGFLRARLAFGVRAIWHQGVYEVLGTAHVWVLQRLQPRSTPQHAHRHDVQLVPNHI